MSQDINHLTSVADDWIAWAREPGHDAFWVFQDAFSGFVGPGTSEVADIGCGEGRVSRMLGELGYRPTAIDPVPAMVQAAQKEGSATADCVASATSLPFDDNRFGMALLYNCLMDIDDVDVALAEARRVTTPGGRVLISLVHPSADLQAALGETEDDGPNYFQPRPFSVIADENGLKMHFAGWARPLSWYTDALRRAGLRINRIAEPQAPNDPARRRGERWTHLPLFLWIETHV